MSVWTVNRKANKSVDPLPRVFGGAVFWSALLFVAQMGCASAASRPCNPSDSCPMGEVCVVGRCAGDGLPGPIPTASRRRILSPAGLLVVSSDDEGDGTSPTVTVGASRGPTGRILVRFAPGTDVTSDNLLRAYLVVDREPRTTVGPETTRIFAERVIEPWSNREGPAFRWSSPPKSEKLDASNVLAPPHGLAPIRIDVTTWARQFVSNKVRTFGLRIEGEGSTFGITVRPFTVRLELYAK